MLAAVALTACGRSPAKRETKFLQKGQRFFAQKDYARALLEFKNAALAMPADAEPYYQIGVVAATVGRIPEAAAAFRKASELNPKHTAAQLRLAELMALSRNKDIVEQAESRLRQVLTLSPDDPEATDTLALAESRLGQAEDAEELLEHALAKFPARLHSSVALAHIEVSRRDLKGAEETLRKAVESAPKSAAAAVALADFYMALEKTEPAEQQLQRALGLKKDYPPALLALAALQVRTKRLDQADATYRKIAALPDKRYRALHAMFLMQQNRREEALHEFEALYRQDPSDRSVRSRLVASYVVIGRSEDAMKVLNEALKKDSKDVEALSQRSQLYLRSGKAQEAELDVAQIIHEQPDLAGAHFTLAQIHKLEGRIESARQELREALRLNPGLIAARLALARSFIARRQGREAVAVLDATPANQKNVVAVLVERNWALLVAGALPEAKSGIDRLLATGRIPEARLQDGTLKLGERDYAGAVAEAGQLLRDNPEDVRAARILRDAYAAQGRLPAAIQRVRELVAQRPHSAPLQILLGQTLLSAKDTAGARAAFEGAKTAAPELTEPGLALAGLDAAAGRLANARKEIALAVAADPGNLEGILLQAQIEGLAGDRAAAIAKYRRVLDLDAANLSALNNMAYLLAEDQPDEALRWGQRALELAPNSPAIEDTLGWVYYHKGLYRGSIEYLSAAMKAQPTPSREYHLGMSYLKAGNVQIGQRLVSEAVQKDPTLVEASKSLPAAR
jgi:tetratricopeptide (TPR) repeat protein